MPSSPLVSIVIPAYRAERTLGAAISGALTQTYPDVEVIVVDDGSPTPDPTEAMVASYGGLVRYVRRENGGVAAARNSGAEAASGELLLFCDSDDMLLPAAVARAVEVWRAGSPRRIVTLNAYPMTREGINPKRHRVMERFPAGLDAQRLEILRGNFVSVFGLIPRPVFDELGGYDGTLRVVEDWDMWLRAIHAGIEIAYVEEPQALYRWKDGSLSSDRPKMLDGEDLIFGNFAARSPRLTEDERALLDERLRGRSPARLRTAADEALAAGDVARAAELYAQVSRQLPHDRRLRARALSLKAGPRAAAFWRGRDAKFADTTGREHA